MASHHAPACCASIVGTQEALHYTGRVRGGRFPTRRGGALGALLALVGLRQHRVEGHAQHGLLGLVPPLVAHLRGN